MAQARPSRYVRWATALGALVLEPNEGKKDTGNLLNEVADPAEHNWRRRELGNWTRYLDERAGGRELRGTSTWKETALSYAAGVGLVSTLTPGVAYRNGVRLELDAARIAEQSGVGSHTFTASRDTYVGIDDERAITFQEVANAAPPPVAPAGVTHIMFVETDVANVVQVRSIVSEIPEWTNIETRIGGRLWLGMPSGTTTDVRLDSSSARDSALSAWDITTMRHELRWQAASSRVVWSMPGAAHLVLATTATTAVDQDGQIAIRHRTPAEESLLVFNGRSTAAEDGYIDIGGGSASFNAAQRIRLWGAANGTTTTGTMMMEIQGATLVYFPVGLVRVGDGIAASAYMQLDAANLGDVGIEHRYAGVRKWLGPALLAGTEDLVFYHDRTVGTDEVVLRLVASSHQVEVTNGLRVLGTYESGVSIRTDRGMRIAAATNTTSAMRLNTHIGDEAAVFDADDDWSKTAVGITNTNGNEDIIIGTAGQLGLSSASRDRAAIIDLLIIGQEDIDETAIYGRRITLIVENLTGSINILATIADTTHASAIQGGWDATSAAPTVVSGDLVLRVSSVNTLARNWKIRANVSPISAPP
jgi:hypothetical protein